MTKQYNQLYDLKKGVFLFFFYLAALIPYRAAFAQCTTLVWADEFNGTSLDQTKWAYDLGRGCNQPSGCGFGNGEEQSYTNLPKNISVAGGNLTITAIFDNPEPGAAFSSAKIQTLGLKTFQYGKIESRMKLSSGQGAWPAFWMLAQSNNWPYTGEIDIMEAKHKNPTQVLGTVHHYNGFNTGQLTTPDLSAAFHTYAIEWEKDEIRWYFDGALYHRATPQTTGGAWPFNNTGNPFYLIYNLAVGGLGTPFTGNQAFNQADFPTNLQVDYVRVYSGTWNVEFAGDPFVYKGENSKIYSITSVAGAGYNWSVPTGATIASGQGTNQITVNFGTSAVSGNVNVAVTSGCTTQTYSKAVTVEEAFKVTSILKDWDTNNNMTFVSASGTLTQVANPAGSTNVGKYIRNGGQLYDNIIHKNIAFGNASDFVTRRRRIRADIYTTAAVGTKIRIQLENAAKSIQTFPVGRHSVYEIKTTRQNAWETVEFEYVNSPDLGTGSTTVDQMAILVAVETNTSDTYYIDNIVIGTAGDLCPRTLNQTLEDFQTNRNITFNSSTGTLSTVANPSASGANTSAQVGKYIRNSAELYDVLFYKNVVLNNVANFKNGKSVFKMQVYSSAPIGTTISLQLETSASTPTNYPTGRHSLYQGVTSVQNQWEAIEFSYVSSLDALALDSQVNSIVFLYSPNTNNGSTYYFDNLITEAESCSIVSVTGVTVSPTSVSVAAGATTQLSATVAPSNASNKTVTWTSSNTAVATVNSNGLVTGVATGTATITATTQDGAKTATSSITVTTGNVMVTGVTVSPTSASLAVGATTQLTATVAPSNATNKTVTWTSSNTSVATVNASGLVTGVATGTATITVTTQDGAKTATSAITVTTGNIAVTGVTVSPTSASIMIGATQQLTATVAPSNATNKTVTWTSSSNSIATVSSGGLVTGVSVGIANITVTTQDGAKTATASITVTSSSGNTCSGNGPTASGQTVPDYTYDVTSNSGSTVNVKFTAGAPITGCDFVIFNWKVGTGNYAGQIMTQSGSVFNTSVSIASGSVVTMYFTYRRAAGGLESNSSATPHTFTVGQCGGVSNPAPTVSITSPTAGASFTTGSNITINANASDTSPGTVSKVEFFQGATKIGEDLTSPYSIVWSGVVAGSYSLTAKATDDQLATTTSTAVAITVTASNTPPTVSLTAPAAGSSFTAGSNITITATASDTAPGVVTKVEFFQGATKIGEDATSPYSIVWSAVPAGSYSLTAKATDDQLASTVSAARSITVTASTNCTQTSQFGHYTTEISNASSNPTLKFIPGTTGMGSPTCILYYSTSSTGSYPGYNVTPNTSYQITAAAGTTIYYYYTYSLSTGGEQNTSAYKKSFVVGNCSSAGARAQTANEVEQVGEINVYPNPVNDELYFDFGKTFEGGSLKIVTSLGKEEIVRQKVSSGKLDVSSLTPGLYILMMNKDQHKAMKRFIKQ
jgi:uncharacterized protein YjdB/beta-glucanase (GH16 family)/methyltransferase-like protein